MIRIMTIPLNFMAQEEKIKKYGISKENLISVTPLMDSYGGLTAIVTFDEQVNEDA